MQSWLAYVLRRLATSAAVMLGVLVLTYGLSRLSDVDPVLRYLEASETLSLREGGGGDDTYRRAAHRLGADLPVFFFTLSPKHFPDTLHRILPLARRAAYTERLLAGETWPLQDLGAAKGARLVRSSTLILPKVVWHGAPNGFSQFTAGLLRGQLGYSLNDGQPVADRLAQAFRVTLPLALLALLLAFGFGVVLGVNLAWRKWAGLRYACYALLSSPGFFLSTVAVNVLTGKGHWFPGPGWVDAGAGWGAWCAHAAVPVLIFGLPAAAYVALVLEESLLQADRLPVRDFGRLQGRSEAQVWWQDMLPLGLVPSVVTVLGLLLPSFLGGAVVVEYVFNIPGLGRLVFESILSRDWPVVLGVVLLSSGATILGYVLIDLLNAWIDPRWRKFLSHAR